MDGVDLKIDSKVIVDGLPSLLHFEHFIQATVRMERGCSAKQTLKARLKG